MKKNENCYFKMTWLSRKKTQTIRRDKTLANLLDTKSNNSNNKLENENLKTILFTITNPVKYLRITKDI